MTHKPYPRYKETGVKWIEKVPELWKVKRLKHIADVRLSNVDKHTVEGQKVVRLCNYLDVYNNGHITSKIDFMSATASDEQIERLSLQKDDVIITKDSEDPSDIGIPALVEEDIIGLVCGYHLAILRPTASNGEYLHYLLQSTLIRSAFEIEATGMTRYALGKYSIENLTFALPHQSEQIAIASFLDQETSRIDTLISEKERLISLLQEYRQALISHAVTKGLDPKVKMKDSGVEWLGEVPEHWEVKRLKHIANVRLSNVDKHTVEGQKVVRLCNYLDVYNHRNITSKIDFMSATASDEQIERLSLQKDDVIITKDSEDPSDIGIPALVAEDIFGLVCGYHLAILRPTASNGEYLYYLLQSTFVRSAFEIVATGMTRYALGKYSIENLAFALPNQSEQTSISSFLDRKTSHIDTLISKAQKFIDLLKEYRSSLITAAVTGKIDVREVVSSGSEKRDIVHE